MILSTLKRFKKFGYIAVSSNLEAVAADIPALAGEFESWKAVDLVAAYHHPDLGLLIANPKNAVELANFGALRKWELLVIYAGKGDAVTDELCRRAAELALLLFKGGRAKVPPELRKGKFAASTKVKKSAKTAPARKSAVAPPVNTAAVSKGPVQRTPLYSVVVSNELFHNGNVEAWKRIIDSYTDKHPELQVHIYYEGERIFNINSLLVWGKVKNGSTIQFTVSGNEIKDVSKLQRYLTQGASSRFEAFLQTSVRLFV